MKPKLAWFDELLNTQMKICRGSGVLVKERRRLAGKQYIPSTMVPNDLLDTVIKLKTPAGRSDHPGAGKEIMPRNRHITDLNQLLGNDQKV